MPNPMISVIIPTRNRQQLVTRAVESVLRQDFRDFEIIVIDDGGTDGTRQALEGRCRVLLTGHCGPAGARNAGIAQARGTYLAFLDSDDYWRENHLSSLLGPMSRPDVGMVYSPTQTATLDGRPLGGRRDRRQCDSGRIVASLFEHIFIHTSNVLCRTELVRQVGGFDESLPVCEDYHLWLRLALRCEVGLVREPTATRCWHGHALSRQDRLRNAVVRAAMLERFYVTEGGLGAVPRRVAHRRLGKVFFQAGRALAWAAQPVDAMKFFTKSLRYRPIQVRGGLGYLGCLLRRGQADQAAGVQRLLGRLAWTV